MKKYQNTRLWTTTLYKLRIAAALNGLSIIELIDRFVNDELIRLGQSSIIEDAEKQEDK